MWQTSDTILAIYEFSVLEITTKDDQSPVTTTDLAVHHILSTGLSWLTLDIPVVSENDPESLTIPETYFGMYVIVITIHHSALPDVHTLRSVHLAEKYPNKPLPTRRSNILEPESASTTFASGLASFPILYEEFHTQRRLVNLRRQLMTPVGQSHTLTKPRIYSPPTIRSE